MKKIIACALVLVSLFALASCSIGTSAITSGTAVSSVYAMYRNSDPTKTVVKSEQSFGELTLKGEQTLVKGQILYEGEWRDAVIYQWSEQQRASIEEEKGPLKTVTGSMEFVDGLGVRKNLGKWQAGADFSPAIGQMALTLTASALTDVSYNDGAKTLSFTVSENNLAAVFGEDTELTGDVAVTIVHDGAVVTDVVLKYSAPATDELPNGKQITIHTIYTYDSEQVELLKK